VKPGGVKDKLDAAFRRRAERDGRRVSVEAHQPAR
jgi:hypothetical protein